MTPKYWRIYTNKLWKAFSGHNDAIISIIICLGNHFDLDVILKKKKEKTKNTPPAHIPPHKKNKENNNPKKPKQLCTTKYHLYRNVFISFHRIYNYCIINLWRKVICIFMQYDILGVIATPEAKNITFLASTTFR